MIRTITLKFGRSAGLAALKFQPTPVTIFVGPNNSGKSKVLREIEYYCRTGQQDAAAVILGEVHFDAFTAESAASEIENLRQSPNPGEAVAVGQVIIGSRNGRTTVNLAGMLQILENPVSNLPAFCQNFLTLLTMKLDGQSRIGLVNEQQVDDLQKPSHLSLQILFCDDIKRREVRRIVAEAFDTYFVVDPTRLGKLRIRLSTTEPKDDIQERGIHADAVSFHEKAMLIEQASDGVKAFTGILTEISAGDPKVMLIDEPEAFLHPSLASKLGYEVSRAAGATDKRVFVATHSPMFLMGCIQSGVPINIVRLTYKKERPTARLLPSADILQLMRNPLLRSTGVLGALFYEYVIITESDADRAFYQEVNERLNRLKPEWGIQNCLFLNAQNKQTIHTILKPLRQLGIPAAGIVDIDALKEGGVVWTNMLAAANFPAISHGPMATARAAVMQAFTATGKNMKRDGGVSILGAQEKEAARNLLDQLAEYGIFVIPGGELESWLKSLGAQGHGPAWLIDVFEKMKEDPVDVTYVKPAEDDVWKFISTVRQWLSDPERKGIPN